MALTRLELISGALPRFELVRGAGQPFRIEGPADGRQLPGVGKPVDGALPRAKVDGGSRHIRYGNAEQ